MFIEVKTKQLSKTGEELCGDSIGRLRDVNETVLVLADGLGSGVKANILSTLTEKIALKLFKENLPIDDIVETIASTLPTCKVRHMAYSTFTIVRIKNDGETDIVEFDNPRCFIFRGATVLNPEYEVKSIKGIELSRLRLKLEKEDSIILVSDGVTNSSLAGNGKEWSRTELLKFVQDMLIRGFEPVKIAESIIQKVKTNFNNHIRDDASVAVVKCRDFRDVVLAIGTPSDRSNDTELAGRFASLPGKKIISGGTLSKIIARELNRELVLDSDPASVPADVPPGSSMDGADLVTEGIITLMHAIDEYDRVPYYEPRKEVMDIAYLYSNKRMGAKPARLSTTAEEEKLSPAKQLAEILRKADRVTILHGQGLNKASTGEDTPVEMGLKSHLVQHLAGKLRDNSVDVIIEYY
ncbi:MAG TPA: SpoIIE family protein phosphatase [bacterium]|nr:SpoIIE family protein phosphatase [bacterium]